MGVWSGFWEVLRFLGSFLILRTRSERALCGAFAPRVPPIHLRRVGALAAVLQRRMIRSRKRRWRRSRRGRQRRMRIMMRRQEDKEEEKEEEETVMMTVRTQEDELEEKEGGR